MTKPIVQMKINLPPVLREWLKERAARNRRSTNAELLVVMEEAQQREENVLQGNAGGAEAR